MGAGQRRAERHAKQLRDLAERQFSVVPQQQNLTIGLGQSGQRGRQPVLHFARLNLPGGAFAARGLMRRDVRVVRRRNTQRHLRTDASTATSMVAGQIRGDSEQPGLEAADVLVAIDRPDHTQERLLKVILGDVRRARQAQEQPVDPRAVPLDQGVERQRLASPGPGEQFVQVGRVHTRLPGLNAGVTAVLRGTGLGQWAAASDNRDRAYYRHPRPNVPRYHPRVAEKTYIFAGGGTGGHLYPGIAIAQALCERDPAARVVFLTTNRPLDRQLLEPAGFERIEQTVQPFTLHPLRIPAFWWRWRQSVGAAERVIRQRQARLVLGLGGYAAGPAVVAGHRIGAATAILNPDAIPGRANRYLATRSSLVVLQWDASRPHFPRATPCETLGCPIRPQFATADGAAARRRFELDPVRPLLVVTGASQGARTVNLAMLRAWPNVVRMFAEWQVLHLSGSADEATVREGYRKAGLPARVEAFTHEMADVLAAADLVVSRAGASTLAELTALGKPSILLPYPYHKDRHQHANAQVLVDAGAAILVEDWRDAARTAPGLEAALSTLADPARRAEMAAAARRLGRPGAAGAIADRLLAAGG